MRHLVSKKKELKLELTPLIDIVFILLIFFAVSTSLITNNKGIPLDLPQAESVETNQPGVVISVKKTGDIYIDGEAVSFEGIQPFIMKKIAENPNLDVVLNADQSLVYELVVKILDVIRLSGATKISLQAEKTIIK